MPDSLFHALMILPYALASLGLMAFGFNSYVLMALYLRRRVRPPVPPPLPSDRWPSVTTQIALFNERHVAERALRAACAMDYPRDLHEIQVLDDSTDDTHALVQTLAGTLRGEGHRIQVLHRDHREGYKAGALAGGLRVAAGDLIAVFDADFLPPKDFLTRMAPLFLADDRLGLAQARWGHLNRQHSWLTRLQALGIDGHFVVEQAARCWNGLFMNFNGTCGIWRRDAIEEAGGWHWDTLTEDLDLSYRVQFRGWRTAYVPDLVVPGEIPEDINALRGQQFRWAKGSFQTLLKHFRPLIRQPIPWFRKIQALFHMGGYAVHPLMLCLSLFCVPALYLDSPWREGVMGRGPVVLAVGLCMIAPSLLYVLAQVRTRERWWRCLPLMPMLVVLGVGFALSNSVAIWQAIRGRETPFVRTPKRGHASRRSYAAKLSPLVYAETLLGLYGLWGFAWLWQAPHRWVAPFSLLYGCGYLTLALFSVSQFRQALRPAVEYTPGPGVTS